MFGYIYKITINNPESRYNGKYYIGQHKSSSKEDGYFGSGYHIKQYKNKYGILGLNKVILAWANSRDELNSLEEKFIGDLYKIDANNINLKDGGLGSDFSDEIRGKISRRVKEAKPITLFTFVCQQCDKDFQVSRNVHGLNKKFCSRQCADKGRSKQFSKEEIERRSKYAKEHNPNNIGKPAWNKINDTITLKCKGCGENFKVCDTAHNRKRQYCSVRCRQLYSQAFDYKYIEKYNNNEYLTKDYKTKIKTFREK